MSLDLASFTLLRVLEEDLERPEPQQRGYQVYEDLAAELTARLGQPATDRDVHELSDALHGKGLVRYHHRTAGSGTYELTASGRLALHPEESASHATRAAANQPQEAPTGPAAEGAGSSEAEQPRFEFIGHLGQGAHADVWQARDTRLQRDVAIKIVRAAGEGVSDALGHGRALARVRNPNVITVHDVLPVQDPEGSAEVHGVVMELLPAQRMGDALEGRSISSGEAGRIGLAILNGLNAIHQEGLVHHDLHEGNILVAGEEVKIIDILYRDSLQEITTKLREGRIERDFTQLFDLLYHLLEAADLECRPLVEVQSKRIREIPAIRKAFEHCLVPEGSASTSPPPETGGSDPVQSKAGEPLQLELRALAEIVVRILVIDGELEQRMVNPWLDSWRGDYAVLSTLSRELAFKLKPAAPDLYKEVERLSDALDEAANLRLSLGSGPELKKLTDRVKQVADELKVQCIDTRPLSSAEIAEASRCIQEASRRIADLDRRKKKLIWERSTEEFQAEVSGIGRELLEIGHYRIPDVPEPLLKRLQDVGLRLHLIETRRIYLDGGNSQDRLAGEVAELTQELASIAQDFQVSVEPSRKSSNDVTIPSAASGKAPTSGGPSSEDDRSWREGTLKFFYHRICDAFPGTRGVFVEEDPNKAIQCLKTLLRDPLSEPSPNGGEITPIWNLRGIGSLGTSEFHVVSDDTIRLGPDRYKIGSVAAVRPPGNKKDCVVIFFSPEEPTGLYEGERAFEEYAVDDSGIFYTRGEYDDGATLRDGPPRPIEARLETRRLARGCIALCAQFSPLHDGRIDRERADWLEWLSKGEKQLDEFAAWIEGLPVHRRLD